MARDAMRARLHQPSDWIATWFGAGCLPKAPGTWGSLAALPPAWAIAVTLGAPGLFAATLLAFCGGLWATSHTLRRTDESDPSSVVIDEVAGQWLTLLAVPPTVAGYALAFVLFRIFDIVKPWPIRMIERRIPGAWGVMLDDILAALYALAILVLIRAVIPGAGLS
jgi:phosphatidylglycerophosphatase A